MYCENLAEKFKDSLVGTWCHEEQGDLNLAPGLDGFATNQPSKLEGVVNLSGPKTIVAWVNMKDFERTSPLVSYRPAEPDIEAGWHLWILPTGQPQFAAGDGSPSCEKLVSPFHVRRHNVSFIAIVRDEEKMYIFCDGRKSDFHYVAQAEKAASNLFICQDPVIPWNKFDGLAQCVSVFDRALTDQELNELYQVAQEFPEQLEQAE
jgi:hypothetical protein